MFLISLYFSLISMGSSCSQCATEVLLFQTRNAVVLNPERREILLLTRGLLQPKLLHHLTTLAEFEKTQHYVFSVLRLDKLKIRETDSETFELMYFDIDRLMV